MFEDPVATTIQLQLPNNKIQKWHNSNNKIQIKDII